MITKNDLLTQKGWTILDQSLGDDLLKNLRLGMEQAYSECRAIQVKNGIDTVTNGTNLKKKDTTVQIRISRDPLNIRNDMSSVHTLKM